MTGVQRLLETGLILCGALAIFLLTALLTFDPADPSWSQTGHTQDIQNAAGAIGAWFADIMLFTFGVVGYLIPFLVMGLGYLVFHQPRHLFELDFLSLGLRLVGAVLVLVGATALASLQLAEIYYFSAGGLLGDIVTEALQPYFALPGTVLILLTFLLVGLTLVTGISWLTVIDRLGDWVLRGLVWLWRGLTLASLRQRRAQAQAAPAQPAENTEPEPNETANAVAQPNSGTPATTSANESGGSWWRKLWPVGKASRATQAADHEGQASTTAAGWDDLPLGQTNLSASPDEEEPDAKLEAELFAGAAQPANANSKKSAGAETSGSKQAAKSAMAPVAAPEAQSPPVERTSGTGSAKPQTPVDPMPALELLDRPNRSTNPMTKEELDQVSQTVEAVLKDFGVDVEVAGVQPGPVITRFELDLAPGVKVNKISNLAKDIARTLSAVAVRVVEVIPGKSYVGLELPNKHREVVQLSEVIGSDAFVRNKSPLSLVLGKDIAGKPVVADLAKMPHLLVAGTTGSGKSVGINVMILSLLYKSTPEDVRLIMIDPKMLELSVYEGIPHLLTEVVTDMKDAANALRWCVGEMERRYQLMSALGVRNLKGYNDKVEAARKQGQPLQNPIWKPGDTLDERPPELEKLPHIVVVVDEFADMMMIVGKKVEELIARIAQKARAAGIHLILATQRPSVDVITGLIKANIPTRMAFQVSSKVDSRTILDQPGAEQLLGQGDMLYLPPGSAGPTRVHGAFVDDHEVHAVVADWKKRSSPQYLAEILQGDQGEAGLLPGEQGDEDAETDALYDEAVAFVTKTRKVSVSRVQRQFRIGYNRAARIVEQMEASGVVSSAGQNGAREVLAPEPPRD